MKSAKELFEELKFIQSIEYDSIHYRFKNDYRDISIFFYTGEFLPKTYSVTFLNWIDYENKDGWLPMSERKETLKHCSAYGRWQIENESITIDLHKAINKQVEELGWNE